MIKNDKNMTIALSSRVDDIYVIYNSEKLLSEKWLKIAELIDNDSIFYLELLQKLRKHDNLYDIGIIYDVDIIEIMSKIKIEENNIRKISFIISALHYMIYDMMSTEGNYLFMLNGKDQMAILPEDILYYISISETNDKNIYFNAYIIIFGLESLFVKNLYVGIDFEFTDNIIRLAQLNFEHSKDNRSFILIISPRELTESMTENFIEFVICNIYIKKILHGSDSKDTPYIYDELLNSDPDKIIEFTRTLIDTKLLCDYYKLNRVNVTDNRCSIYSEDKDSSAVYYFGVVSEDQQENLSKILDKMPVDISWNIHKLTIAQKMYAQYDVIFLKYFYYRIINMACQDSDTKEGKNNIVVLYRNILTQLTQYSYLESKEITYLSNRCKEEVDALNNYFYRDGNKIVKMIDIFNKVSKGLIYDKYDISIDNIMEVAYFKKKIQIILKRIIYGHISRTCKIYQNKNTIWTDRLYNDFIVNFFRNDIKLYYLGDIFDDLNNKLSMIIKIECGKK